MKDTSDDLKVIESKTDVLDITTGVGVITSVEQVAPTTGVYQSMIMRKNIRKCWWELTIISTSISELEKRKKDGELIISGRDIGASSSEVIDGGQVGDYREFEDVDKNIDIRVWIRRTWNAEFCQV